MRVWADLTRAVAVVRNVQRAEQMLRGGVISDALVEFSAVMVASAGDDLDEARTSPDPRRRLEDAASTLQKAYHGYARALQRGAPGALRTLTGRLSRQYREALGSVAGSASAVAVLRAYLGEPESTLRKWIDRIARPVALEREAAQASWEYQGPFLGQSIRTPGDAAIREHLLSYFNLEHLLLPPTLVRPLPRAWKLIDDGVVARTKRELMQLEMEAMAPEVREWRQRLGVVEELFLPPSTDEPGPNDVILWLPAADVVPAFGPSAEMTRSDAGP